jgi:undecaprenyl diphosphate synthase
MDKKPECIGIIMDGNRRWAKENGLPAFKGHLNGYKKLKEVITWMKEKGIKCSIYYSFSTENWKRSNEEVSYLMGLIRKAFSEEVDSLKSDGIKIKAVGDMEAFPEDIQDKIRETEEETEDNKEHTIVLAASYGGRAEILNAVNELIKKGVNKVTEKIFSDNLWTTGIPDPDIIIRTSGEQRLSGFLPWQGVYSELFFVKNHWPAFSKADFENILEEYANRDRRYGGDGKKK